MKYLSIFLFTLFSACSFTPSEFVCENNESDNQRTCVDGVWVLKHTDAGSDDGTIIADMGEKDGKGLDSALLELCGNGFVDPGEECDDVLDGKLCTSFGFDGGALACTAECKFDKTECYKCGDGSRHDKEACDGKDLGGKSCESLAFESGALSCDDNCSFDTSKCIAISTCNNGTLEPREECDVANDGRVRSLPGKTCVSEAGDGYKGDLGCASSCKFDTSDCYICGDQIRHPNEACEDGDFGGKTCKTEKGSKYKGDLKCDGSCLITTEECYSCGDGHLSGSEICDGNNLNGNTCETALAGYSGTLKCTSCRLDVSECQKCGDGRVSGTESCDGNNLNGNTCETAFGGDFSGALACDSCAFDSGSCFECGDNIKNGTEVCDGPDLGGETCPNNTHGAPTCKADCQGIDISSCVPDYTMISSGGAHNCALQANDGIYCWGLDTSGSTTNQALDFRQVDSGGFHNCAIKKSDNSVHCWGDDTHNQVSDQPSGNDFRMASAGFEHSCALKQNGTIKCWGNSSDARTTVATLDDGNTYTYVSAGSTFTCALTTRNVGNLKCWGGGIMVPNAFEFRKIDSGYNGVCGIAKVTNKPYCYSIAGNSFPLTDSDHRYKDIATGGVHACAIRQTGDIQCWGVNTNQQLDHPIGTDFTGISAGEFHSCALKTDGTVVCWGKSANGRTMSPP